MSQFLDTIFTAGLSESIAQGAGTTSFMKSLGNEFAALTNKAIKTHAAIKSDKTRTKAEKANLYLELKTNYESKAEKLAVRANVQTDSSITNWGAERNAYLSQGADSNSFATALWLSNQPAEKALSLAGSDPRFVAAINQVPAEITGLTADSIDGINSQYLKRTNPDLHERGLSLRQDVEQGAFFTRTASSISNRLYSNVDTEALKTRTESINTNL